MKSIGDTSYQMAAACLILETLLSEAPEVDLIVPAECLRAMVPDPSDRNLLALRLAFLSSFVCADETPSMLATLKEDPEDPSLLMRDDDASASDSTLCLSCNRYPPHYNAREVHCSSLRDYNVSCSEYIPKRLKKSFDNCIWCGAPRKDANHFRTCPGPW